MRYRILGPLEIDGAAGPVLLPSARRRALLIALLVHRDTVVSAERLLAWLWPGGTPPSAVSTLQGHVSLLRKALEPERGPGTGPRRLITRPAGYLLRVGGDQVDADRFERLAEQGRLALAAGDPARASRLLREALRLWRGDALADVATVDAATGEIARLEGLRLCVIGQRVDADLRLGRHHEAVPELERLTAERPLDERMRAQLMLALYRCGRQGEALAVYQQARAVLARELGVEPSPSLRRLSEAIRGQDPDLEWRPWTPARSAF